MSEVQKSDKTVTAGAVRTEEGAVERPAGDAPPAPVRFDTKVVVVLSDDLAAWQELNVTAFLMSGIATSAPDLVGEPYRDADGVEYLPMLREPVMVMSASGERLARARAKARTWRSPSTPANCSRPDTMRPTARRWPEWRPRTSTSWGSPCADPAMLWTAS
jgi:hypothetical protein